MAFSISLDAGIAGGMFVPASLLMPPVMRFCAPAARSNGPVTMSVSPLPTPWAPTVKSRTAPPTLLGSSDAGRSMGLGC
ncbi:MULTISPECIES: hypothetical protein [unclassified Bradyrhizobium]|uniref:hypothetical protein n=1 Tax=unclassified Bradyrhizobium TaxID=2631580 RepID=UPI001FFBFD00|nr:MULTISPECIES: hypothetical protein [unclassified Bradyrhizobium]MCK1346346.1 hypothetical protein [Bradyrhizobium sp. CW11]MCK1588540.1 hypothetical protein [Bradyrhizobium sp. 169]